jgi:type IV pilus assembly protein PilW
MRARAPFGPRAARGAGLVETMIGILIGLIVVLVIYNLLAASESYKRMATGSSDAQITGLLSQFIVGREASNGGNGISISASDLFACDPAKANNAWPYNRTGVPALWRPIPALVRDGGSNDTSDSFITMYSGSPHVVWPVTFTAAAAAGAAFTVQSPNGFTSPVPAAAPALNAIPPAAPYLVVAINPTTGDCEDTIVTAATAADPFGQVTLTHGATSASYVKDVSRLVNLGPVGIATRTLFEDWDPTAGTPCSNGATGCQIYSTDLLTAGASRVPLAQNVVLMKVQYGLDTSNPIDGSVECWTSAVAAISGAGCTGIAGFPGDWSYGTVVNATQVNLQRIVALRVGLVVRSDEKGTQDEQTNPASPLLFANRPPMFLFNCGANTAAACVNRIPLSNAVIQDGWRYRTFEAVIPLRNAIFNSLP